MFVYLVLNKCKVYVIVEEIYVIWFEISVGRKLDIYVIVILVEGLVSL